MSAQLPDCMIGPSEPCAGYQELRAELDTAIRRAENLECELAATLARAERER